MSHGLLLESSDHAELRFDFAYHVANDLVCVCNALSPSSLEVHGVGLIEKVYDITTSLVKAMGSSSQMTLESSFTILDPLVDRSADSGLAVQALLHRLGQIIFDFRGGDHEYVSKITMALSNIPGYNSSTQSSYMRRSTG